MSSDVSSKFLAYVKNKKDKSFSGSTSDASVDPPADEAEDTSPHYDLACRLCSALGVDEDKAGEVADILHEFKQTE